MERVQSYEAKEVLGFFEDADAFETATERLLDSGIRQDAIHLMASHDAVNEKLRHVYGKAKEDLEDEQLPEPIFEDAKSLKTDKALALGVPAYIGGAGAGLAVVASGGTIAFAALAAAACASAGAGVGSLLRGFIGRHHAKFLEEQLSFGHLVISVDVSRPDREPAIIAILKEAGANATSTHTVTRYEQFDEHPLEFFDPYTFQDRVDFGRY
ncbi:hypothetical protein B9057_14375 (plasmid) [Aestuarium zhoushanense]|nr:hypothetical protein B9057_14375 [Aestuarium zhoushanense]